MIESVPSKRGGYLCSEGSNSFFYFVYDWHDDIINLTILIYVYVLYLMNSITTKIERARITSDRIIAIIPPATLFVVPVYHACINM